MKRRGMLRRAIRIQPFYPKNTQRAFGVSSLKNEHQPMILHLKLPGDGKPLGPLGEGIYGKIKDVFPWGNIGDVEFPTVIHSGAPKR